MLDFTSCANRLGKPSAADLRLGLATGPVLFACQQVPHLTSQSVFYSKGSRGLVVRELGYQPEGHGFKPQERQAGPLSTALIPLCVPQGCCKLIFSSHCAVKSICAKQRLFLPSLHTLHRFGSIEMLLSPSVILSFTQTTKL